VYLDDAMKPFESFVKTHLHCPHSHCQQGKENWLRRGGCTSRRSSMSCPMWWFRTNYLSSEIRKKKFFIVCFATALGMDTRGLNLVVSLPSNAVYLTSTNYGRGEGGREAALESLTSQCSSILLVYNIPQSW